MSEAPSLKKALLHWDEQHVKSLICEPEDLLALEPWSSWVKEQGGLAAIYTSLRSLPLSERQRKTLTVLLNEPGASLQKYALQLHVSVATYVRHRSALVKTLEKILNARLLEKQPVKGDRGGQPAATRTNLPYQPTPLIGRTVELQKVRSLLATEGVNLVTITGPGGIGKTRLSLQVASDLADEFEQGTFFIPLAAITNPDLVAGSIARTLDLKGGENQPVIELLKEFFQGKHILLLLDNFEQVTAAAPWVGELLESCPGLKILVTSRAVLHLRGEYEFNVPPLAIPDLEHLPSLADLAAFPAVALFVGRAQAVRNNFALDQENAPVVAEICIRLEGIPLALELAAARIKLFAPGALLKGLNHRLAFLTRKSADEAPRHQTLRNAIDWSYQLLSPEEQLLFTSLGVFAGGCTLEAVEAVCKGDDEAEGLALERLASLVDQSMLQHTARPDGEPRFMLLETLREYAMEQLEASGQMETIRQRHLDFFLGLVESIEPGPKEPNLSAWMRELESEHGNLRLALQWALDRDQVEAALRIAGAIWRFWQIHGHVEEGSQWLKLILERSQGQRNLPRAKALWGAGWLGMVAGRLIQSRQYFEEGAALSRELHNDRFLGLALHGIGAVARAPGDFERSQGAFEESLPLFRALESAEDVAWTYEHLGVTALEQGHFQQAEDHLSQASELFRSLDQRWPCAEALTFLGHAALQQRDFARAREQYEKALKYYEELEDKPNVAAIHSCIGATHFGEGNVKRAVRIYKENLALSREMKDYWGLVWGVERLAEAAEKLSQPEQAARLWGGADTLRHIAGVLWHPGFHSYYTDVRFAGIRAQLGETRWSDLWRQGQKMGDDEIVACALAV